MDSTTYNFFNFQDNEPNFLQTEESFPTTQFYIPDHQQYSIEQDFQQLDVDVVLGEHNHDLITLSNLIPQFSDDQQGIKLHPILEMVNAEIPLKNDKVFFYDYQKQVYIFCGKVFELPTLSIIPLAGFQNKFGGNKTITLKINVKTPTKLPEETHIPIESSQGTSIKDTGFQNTASDTDLSFLNLELPNQSQTQTQKDQDIVCEEFLTQIQEQGLTTQYYERLSTANSIKKKKVDTSKYTKNRLRGKLSERLVGEVLDLINKWRQLYKKGHSLVESAEMVGAPKKSLDDYLRICKHAKRAEFDFSQHLMEKFGVVRGFVRDLKKKEEQQKKKHKNDTDDDFEDENQDCDETSIYGENVFSSQKRARKSRF